MRKKKLEDLVTTRKIEGKRSGGWQQIIIMESFNMFWIERNRTAKNNRIMSALACTAYLDSLTGLLL